MTASAGEIVAAVLLPPLGVFLAAGAGRDFAITCALTLLAFLPGVIFALFVILGSRADPALA